MYNADMLSHKNPVFPLGWMDFILSKVDEAQSYGGLHFGRI